MGDGKNKKDTGDFDPSTVALPEGYKVVKADEVVTKDALDGIVQRLDAFDQRFNVTDTPPAIREPEGPTLQEQLADIDKDIEAIDTQIDAAVADAKPISKLQRDRDKLIAKKYGLETNSKFESFTSDGLNVIGQLADEVLIDKMPHLKIPEVKKDYDEIMRYMPLGARSSPKSRMEAYNLAIGRNVLKVNEVITEERQRREADDESGGGGQDKGGGGTGRQHRGATGDEKPAFEDYFGPTAMAAIKAKGMTKEEWCKKFVGMTPEEYPDQALEQDAAAEGGNA